MDSETSLLLSSATCGRLTPELAEKLCEQGVNPNVDIGDGTTALHIVSKKGMVKTLRKLLELGASVNVRDWQGKTPLMEAACENRVGVVNALLAGGAKVGDCDWKGQSALFFAASNGRSAILKSLVTACPSECDRRDKDGKTALHAAALAGSAKCV
eukprot:CAMPEP_0113869166 /NCGR_PEP_ID=MMETSP0780_2-20120614/1387_1 /TAXON_ID=652834 /ORGANISM="Palpitomonas bilix" /LENGTH=155 /DNA_ID=CAMNT_0000854317 /DNA_START=136 /DNA_END=599 /DNA_ORIENTATION=+ /assembly_acc=CAM_ASM_000599